MRRMLSFVGLLVGGAFTLTVVAAERPPTGPPDLVVPSRDFRTIQDAINAAEDGAKILILPGVYEEMLTIRGKRLHLVGEGRPEILGPPPDRERVPETRGATGLINYAAGGGGSLRGLLLTGGDNAIVGFRPEEPASALQVQDVRVQGTGRGILWCCASLIVKDSIFAKLAWHAISTPCLGLPLQAYQVEGVVIIDSEKAGIYMSNCPGVASCENNVATNVVKNTSLTFNKGGGVLAVNSQLCVRNVNIDFASTAGLFFVGSAAFTRNNTINFTKFLPGAGPVFGDGIATLPWQDIPSHVTVKDTWIHHPEGFGLRNLGSHMAFKSTSIVCGPNETAFVSDDFGGVPNSFDQQAGNKCGCPVANGSCTTTVGPIEPPPPIGGLE